jgi:hypothetical protein
VFTPAALGIATGDTVRFTWTGVHNVQFADGPASATVANGTFSRRFGDPGTYPYVCTLHDGMGGTVTAAGAPVEIPDDQTTSPPPDDTGGDGGSPATTLSPAVTPTPFSAPARSGSATGGNAFAGPDRTAPRLSALRATLRGRRRTSRLQLTVDEDVRIDVTLRAIGRSSDTSQTRRLRLFARTGTRTLTLPRMTLTAARYRLTIRLVDQAGNRSPARMVVVRRSR